MSSPLRFLAVVVAGWAVVRLAALGAMPGFTIAPARAALPPIVPSQLAAYEPQLAEPAAPWDAPQLQAPRNPAYPPHYRPVAVQVPYYVPSRMPVREPDYALAALEPRPAWSLPAVDPTSVYYPAAASGYSALPPLDLAAQPAARSTPVPAQPQQPGKLDRWQMSSWALLRGAPSPGTLASGGSLGGSQAGARITYALNHWLAASLRSTSPIGGSTGAEIAPGIRLTPLRSVPVALTLERRQSISRFGGRSDFAMFVEGGLYRQPMPVGFQLDAYAQAGVVGIGRRDLFADGALAFTRPVHGRYSAGLGVWGGYQPGIYRIDAGPRVTVKLRDNIRAHVDYRQRLAGSALPGSGPSLTLAADF